MKLAIAATLVASMAPAAAATSFTNGGFETTTNGNGQLGFNTNATGWTTTGYNFLFGAGTADTTGANGVYGLLALHGPNNGSANGLPAASPTGGNFVAADGAFGTEPISQVITGLTVGATYNVGFSHGYAQQLGFDGPTIQHWTVSFAGQSQSTADYALANHGFSGWLSTTFSFIANNPTETLSFLAYGNVPVPPFALLDGVSFTAAAVPEPATWGMMLIGFAAIGIGARRNRRTAVVAG
jgi:hypothetical protein